MMKRLNLFYFIVLVLGFFSTCLADCEILGFTDDDLLREREKQLLKSIDPLKGEEFTVKDKSYSYKIRICDTVQGEKDGTGAAQYDNKGGKGTVLGLIKDTDITGGGGWITLSYQSGESYSNHCHGNNRTTRIMIICDPDQVKGEFKMLGEMRRNNTANCLYLFELRSKTACIHVDDDKGLSSGSVFCILFFTFFGMYFILGFLYKRMVVGAQGLEQIPNYTFWREFGNLQADACDYVCRCGPRRESHAYRGIDDRLKEERDDQLLN